MKERFQTTGLTHPKDIVYLEHYIGTLSNSLTCRLENKEEKYVEYFNLKNNIEGWKFLKKFNEIGGRTVLYEVHDSTKEKVEIIPFEKAAPYIHRFN